MRGPTPDNPSQSLKKRLKRAAFFDQRERDVAPETAVNYEVGAKADLFNRRLEGGAASALETSVLGGMAGILVAPILFVSIGMGSTPRAGANAWITANCAIEGPRVGSRSTATRSSTISSGPAFGQRLGAS